MTQEDLDLAATFARQMIADRPHVLAAGAQPSAAPSVSPGPREHAFLAAARQLAAREGLSLREAKRRIATAQPGLYDDFRSTFIRQGAGHGAR